MELPQGVVDLGSDNAVTCIIRSLGGVAEWMQQLQVSRQQHPSGRFEPPPDPLFKIAINRQRLLPWSHFRSRARDYTFASSIHWLVCWSVRHTFTFFINFIP